MLLATYNSDQELRVYRLDLDFSHLRITLQHVKVLNHCLPLNEVNEGTLLDRGALPLHAKLSHLGFIPPGPRTDLLYSHLSHMSPTTFRALRFIQHN